MAQIQTTNIPNLSIDSLHGSGDSVPSLAVSSRASFTCAGVAAFSGGLGNSSTFTQTGKLVASGGNVLSGGVAINSALTLGLAGVPFAALRKSTVSVALGTTKLESTTTSATENNVTAGDIVLKVQPASIWSGTYNCIALSGTISANSAIVINGINSGNTNVNTAAMNMDIYWLDLA